MSLYVTSLNSGSNGNCYYIGNDDEALLIDAGISCREIEKRMKRLGLSMQKVKAVVVSHEHTDHIKGLAGVAKKFKLPIYITSSTLANSGCCVDSELVVPFAVQSTINIGNLTVQPFPKNHDAAEPCSFIISHQGATVGVFTDIGLACKQVVKYFKQCHAVFLEANYDDEMLRNSSYPYYLKKRITGGNGHLSNTAALELFKTHRPPFMSHLFLSHLSQNNNCPILVKDLFTKHANGVEVLIASRFEETPVYKICSRESIAYSVKKKPATSQLAFSFV